ncbi:MAG: YraN family protein [Candidatus Mcinerneyibacterium aminivorans]|jgi:putative endonuclease|uniref:UPF0102 protein FXF47_03565 n=1 Tax=Candidatus Mcinerneyibacterium aminivorans TaxID=2703815 RepID=A0A5D0MD88_9BACT|nr:MAG: YraN family protein [Candidatus Mcinerneyibacterium aminivorans]
MKNNQDKGSAGEKKALEYLKKNDYKIIDTNFNSKFGEIDIIAEKGENLVFVEVKYRKGNSYGSPLEAITRKKQRTIIKVSRYYLLLNGEKYLKYYIRYDVIGIKGNNLEHIKGAFYE